LVAIVADGLKARAATLFGGGRRSFDAVGNRAVLHEAAGSASVAGLAQVSPPWLSGIAPIPSGHLHA